MPTLEEILNEDLGLGVQQEKVASAVESDEIEKLAMELGLSEEGTSASKQETTEQIKEAQMGMDNLYSQMFPSDADVVSEGTEKVAELDKEAAAIEEAIGAEAFDRYQDCLDGHITKIAESLAGGATISADKEDGTPTQAMASNEVKGKKAIDTDPEIQDEAMGTNPKGAVGDFEHKSHPNGEMRKQAMRQAYLRSLIEVEGE